MEVPLPEEQVEGAGTARLKDGARGDLTDVRHAPSAVGEGQVGADHLGPAPSLQNSGPRPWRHLSRDVVNSHEGGLGMARRLWTSQDPPHLVAISEDSCRPTTILDRRKRS